MSMVNTLAKVAVGIAVAKGASALMNSRSAVSAGGGGAAGGLAGMLGGLLGGGAQAGQQGMGQANRGQAGFGQSAFGQSGFGQSGGGLFGQIAQQMAQGGAAPQRPANPGLAGVLGGLLGGASAQPRAGAAQPGLGGLAGMLAGATGGLATGGLAAGGAAAGGLGGLLDSLAGGGRASAAQPPAAGGLGDLLNGALAGKPVKPAPSQEAVAELMLRAMINAQKADGQVDEQEKAKLMDQLGDIDAKEAAFVKAEFAKPLDLDGFVASVPAGLEGQVYMMSLMAIDLDSQAEAEYLHALAQKLGVNQQTANNIHQELGAPVLYS